MSRPGIHKTNELMNLQDFHSIPLPELLHRFSTDDKKVGENEKNQNWRGVIVDAERNRSSM